MKHYEEHLKNMGMFNLQLAMERYNSSLQISEQYLFISYILQKEVQSRKTKQKEKYKKTNKNQHPT